MTIKVAINGFGRIGRNVARAIISDHSHEIDLLAINDSAPVETNLHLLKYDSIHGTLADEIEKIKSDLFKINKKQIKKFSSKDPKDIPWGELDIDLVLECTGKFNDKKLCVKHINAGAKKVLISAPAKSVDITAVFGVNHKKINKNDRIISAASCTTNCLAPVADVINKNFIILNGFMTTIHAFTSDQRILDNSHKDPRRARSASQSIVPTSTGASKAIGEIIPSLKGKLEGVAMRVPTPNVSLIEFIFNVKKNITVKKLNNSLFSASKTKLKNILNVTDEKLVSVDFNHNSASAIIDSSLTNVVGNKMGKISAWYDNEWGFSNRMCDIAEYVSKIK